MFGSDPISLLILLIIILGILGIAWVVIQKMEITIPGWLLKILGIVAAVVVGVFFIRFLWGLR